MTQHLGGVLVNRLGCFCAASSHVVLLVGLCGEYRVPECGQLLVLHIGVLRRHDHSLYRFSGRVLAGCIAGREVSAELLTGPVHEVCCQLLLMRLSGASVAA